MMNSSRTQSRSPALALALAAAFLMASAMSMTASATPEKPSTPVKSPAERHFIKKIDQSTVAKDKNTVIESRVDVSRDVRGINDGDAKRGSESGAVTWTIHNRTYGAHSNGTLYPIRGSGFHELNRAAFKALGVYNKFGDGDEAKEILDKMGISSSDRQAALKAYKAG